MNAQCECNFGLTTAIPRRTAGFKTFLFYVGMLSYVLAQNREFKGVPERNLLCRLERQLAQP